MVGLQVVIPMLVFAVVDLLVPITCSSTDENPNVGIYTRRATDKNPNVGICIRRATDWNPNLYLLVRKVLGEVLMFVYNSSKNYRYIVVECF